MYFPANKLLQWASAEPTNKSMWVPERGGNLCWRSRSGKALQMQRAIHLCWKVRWNLRLEAMHWNVSGWSLPTTLNPISYAKNIFEVLGPANFTFAFYDTIWLIVNGIFFVHKQQTACLNLIKNTRGRAHNG